MILSELFIAGLAAYLIGSIPFGLVLTRLAGLGDIRNIGSGNIGATNVLRTGNKKLAALTLLLDGLKGAAPILLARYLDLYPNRNYLDCLNPGKCGFTPNEIDLFLLLLGACAVIGHMFPIWLKFKGGKGVATFFGMMLACNFFIGLLALATWLIAAIVFRRSSLAAIISILSIPAFFLFFERSITFIGPKPGSNLPTPVESFYFYPLCILIPLILLILLKHHENIKRLLNGTEPKIGARTP